MDKEAKTWHQHVLDIQQFTTTPKQQQLPDQRVTAAAATTINKNRINKKTWVQWQQNQQCSNNGCSSNIGSWKLSPPLTQQKGAEELESSSTLRSKYNTSPNKTVNQLVKNIACAVLIIKECSSGEEKPTKRTAVSCGYYSPWCRSTFRIVTHGRHVHKHIRKCISEENTP